MTNPADTDNEVRMTFTEHLAELRTRLIRSAVAIFVGVVVCYIFSGRLLAMIAWPLGGLTPEADSEGKAAIAWTYLNILEPVLVNVRLAAYGGVLVSFPYVLYQICAFIFPGLKPNERKAARIMIVGCSMLVIVGVLVAYFGIFPVVLPFLMQWAPEGVSIQLRASENISIVIKGLMAFAIAFQFPMVVLVLVYMDLLSPATLKKYRRIAVVGLAVASAILTPPDPFSMMIMLVPLLALYETSILLSYLVVRRRKKASTATP